MQNVSARSFDGRGSRHRRRRQANLPEWMGLAEPEAIPFSVRAGDLDVAVVPGGHGENARAEGRRVENSVRRRWKAVRPSLWQVALAPGECLLKTETEAA